MNTSDARSLIADKRSFVSATRLNMYGNFPIRLRPLPGVHGVIGMRTSHKIWFQTMHFISQRTSISLSQNEVNHSIQ